MITYAQLSHRLEVISTFCQCTDRKFFLVLSSSVEEVINSYFGGIRCCDEFVVMSIINLSQSYLLEFGPLIEKYINTIFVDTEKKHPFELIPNGDNDEPLLYYSNLLSQAHQIFNCCRIVPWSPSRLTSEAAISAIRGFFSNDLSGKTISLIGPGSIGFKTALGLVEEGSTVHLYSKHLSKSACLASAINIVKSKYTIASAVQACSLESCITVSDCLVLTASQNKFFTASNILSLSKKCRYVLDVGKSSLTHDALTLIRKKKHIVFQRLDLSSHLIDLIKVSHHSSSLVSSSFEPKTSPVPGIPGVHYVSGGYPGSSGDIVVDDAAKPTFKLGVVDKSGILQEDFALLIDLRLND